MKQKLRLYLVAIFTMIGIVVTNASVSYTCNVGDVLTLKMEDASSTGQNIKKDLDAGRSYVVSSSWSCSDNSAVNWTGQYQTYAYVKMLKTGTYTITHTMKYSSSGLSKNYTYTGTYQITVKEIMVSRISLSPSSVTKTVGESFYISETVYPSNATNKSVSWTSDDFYVASVSNSGYVTVKSAGETKIRCFANDGSGVSAACSVIVKVAPVSVTSISLSPSSKEIAEGETFTISATVYPSNATDKSVSWKSSDTTVATVDSYGKVTSKKAGYVTITCTSNSNSSIKATCAVTVTASVRIENIELSDESLEMTVGDAYELTYKITPADAKSKMIWTSSDTNVSTVENGIITAVGPGTATITCTAKDGSGVSASCSVMVLPYNPVSASEIEGIYQFFLGDFFRGDDSLGMIAGAGSIEIDGKSALLEIDVLNGMDIFAKYNEESGSLIFKQKMLGEVNVDGTSYFCRFEPFVFDEDGQIILTDYFISYDKTRDSFVFPDEHGFILAAYTDAECTQCEGYFDAYLVSCLIKDTEIEGKWIDYDTATYVDGWNLPSFGYNSMDHPWTVSVQQNVENPNLFRISNPYVADGCPIKEYAIGRGNIVFDLSDPENVMVPTGHYCGITLKQNLIEATNRLGYYWGLDSYAFGSYASLQDSMSSWNVPSTYDSVTGTVSFNDCQFMISGDDDLYIWRDMASMMNGQLVFDSKRPGAITGDADDNGKVDIGDAVVICNHYVGKTDDINQGAADVTGDGRIDVQDALAVCNIYLGKTNQKKSKQLTIKRNENQKVYDRRSVRPLGADCQRRLRHHGERITQGVVH